MGPSHLRAIPALLYGFAEVLCLPKGPDSNSIGPTAPPTPGQLLKDPFSLPDLGPSCAKLLFTKCFLGAIVNES